jgi:P22 coat protein - gene protein 5
MVNTIDVTQAQYFIPEIWANRAIPILRENIVVAPRVTRDTDVAAFTRGDILHIPYPGTLAASDKTAGTQYTLAQPTNESEVQVTLDKYKAVSFIVEDIVRAQANMDLINVYTDAAAIALAEQLESDLFVTLGTGTATAVGTAGTDLSASTLQTVSKTLTDAKVPSGGRNIVISTKDKIALLADTTLTNYFAFSQSQAVSEGQLGRVYGLSVFESQAVPTVAGTPIETDNYAWRTDGVILAMRGLPEPPPNTGAVAANVRDPLSGIVMRVVMAYDASYGGVRITMELLYGSKVLQDAKVLQVLS